MKTEVQPNQRNYGEFSWQMDFFEFKFDEDKEPFVSGTLERNFALHNDTWPWI